MRLVSPVATDPPSYGAGLWPLLREGRSRAHGGSSSVGVYSVGSVDRLTLVELIEAQKAKLSPEALKLWEELDASLYMSPQEEAAFIKRREVEIIDRIEQLPEAEQHSVEVLSELRAELYESDLLERRGDPAQLHRDKCVIYASVIKDPDERGRGDPQPPKEGLGRTADQALARLREDY